jgi:hypothetical protein
MSMIVRYRAATYTASIIIDGVESAVIALLSDIERRNPLERTRSSLKPTAIKST